MSQTISLPFPPDYFKSRKTISTRPATNYPEILLQKREQSGDKCDWFELAAPCRFKTALAEYAEIHEGYVTDFASVPRALWSLFPPHGRMANAAIVHDYKYDNRLGEEAYGEERARLVADIEFCWDCAASGVPKWQRFTMFLFIRLFGRKWWRK